MPRPSVANRLNWTRRCSDDSRDAGPPSHCGSSRRARWRWRAACRRTARRARRACRCSACLASRRSSSSRTTGRTRPRASRTASQGASLEQLAQMFVDEGNRYHVRGDIAFAQSIVETAWFNFPDYGIVQAREQQLRGHRRVRLVRQRLPVQQRAERRAGADPAAAQLRRRRLAHDEHPRPAGARAVGQRPGDRGVQLRPLLRQGARAALEQHGQRQLGELARTTRRSCSASTTRCSSYSGQPGQCPPDGLLFGSLTEAGPCPVGAAPAGSRDRDDADRRLLRAQRQRQRQRVQRRARARSADASTPTWRATSR